jgi:hypothetical protein
MRLRALSASVLSAICLAGVIASGSDALAKGTGKQDGQDQKQAAAAAAQQVVECSLAVPADPLSAVGLSTPWLLAGKNGASGGCREKDPNAAAFVQAAVLNPATGEVSIYNPLVIDRGSKPAINPTVPGLPPNPVVGIWVGFNGNTLTLRGPGSAACVAGVGKSVFGQNAFCGTTAFFDAANTAITAGKLTPPDLGTARDGKPCPTSRDFSVVDQDQSDNTTTTYLVTRDGRTAQNTPQNNAALTSAKIAFNGSDEGVVAAKLDPALGCTPWKAPDLADPTHAQQVPAWPLNELQAAAKQAAPVATVPALDPFVLKNNQPDLVKLNAYRAGTDQGMVGSLADAGNRSYCQNLLDVGLPRIVADRDLTAAAPSPFPTMADNLFDFLAMRFQATFSEKQGFLMCQSALGVTNPVKLKTNGDGVVVGAQINLNPPRQNTRTDGDN